jgi:hypothetical protein
MHRRKTDIHRNRRLALIVGGGLAIVVAICLAIIFTAGGGNSGASASSNTRIENVVQPASAAQIAGNLHCTKFKDAGPSELGGVIDSGTCYIGADKYGIDTFLNKDVRDSWLKAAEPLGVNPKWETDTSVTYPSVD